MAFRNYILCFALVAGTINAGPINVQDGDTKCATQCEASLSDTGKFLYTPGNTYTYNYEGTTETKLQGSSEQTTSLKIQATADIEVISRCEFALKLSGVSLQENGQSSSGNAEFKSKLEALPLRFAFQDGKIESVCSEITEDERVLNIKRGVLSTFQNSMDKLDKDGLFDETDVSGTCPTTYTSKTGVFGGITVMKSKDILACADRTGNISSIHSERYTIPSKLQNAPLLTSTHECEQDIESGTIRKTTCSEVLMFRPFSKDGSGAVTKATQTLRYSTYKRSISTAETAVQRRSSMLFHHVYDESIDVNAKSDVIALLREICSETTEGVHSNAPVLFGDLVAKMKRLDSDKMMQVYTAVNGGRICTGQRGKQFFYDAIPMVATEASMALTRKLIVDKTVQGTEAEMWLTQLAFIPRPTVAMLTAVKPLLTDASLRSKALLGISAMVHKICDNMADCGSNAEIADFVSMLTANIGSDCSSSTPEQRELILVTLKAIGNAGDAMTSSSAIGRCVTNQDLDTETRVIALQAYRRVPCSVSREDAMRLYQNAEHDSELRIHAFLAVMSCPDSVVLTKVRMMLSGEPVNQVGSFVWTYLSNLKETSSPLRQELSTILDDAKLREDFNLDVRKFSRNIEKSFFSDYLNAGAQIESNLIWSQKSYIPRSAMLNVTMEMFGNSINLVEFGGRVQGLEKIVEKFFGPNGYFSKKNAKELMDNKRQTANYISSFDNVFKTPDDKMTTSMYIKMFGNEIRFNEMDSSEWTEAKGFNALDFLIKLAEPKKIDLTKNYQFIDSSLIVPTCVGLPMNLTVNGTASVSVDVDGSIDLRAIAASPRSFDINGHIKPSAAVIVSGMMGVDAIVTKSSMKMVATMHSSTHLEGKISLKDGQIFNMELNTPQEKMEIFHVKTEFFVNGQEMTMPEAAKTYKKCSPAGMTRVIGMEMCVDVTLPTFHQTGLPLPPFTGPMNAQVFVEKKDTHTGYVFTAKYENERAMKSGDSYTKRSVHLSLDTPGSQVDRKLLLEGIYNPAEMTASASLLSPWKKFAWNTALTNTVTNKRAMTTMTIDGTDTYSADAQLDIDEKTMKTTWTPSLEIAMPNKPKMSVSGSFVSGIGNVMASANLNIKNFTRKPITLESSLKKIKGGKSYELSWDLKSDALTSSLDSTVSIDDGSYNGRASLVYALAGRPEHRMTASGKFSDNSRGALYKYALQAGFIPTEFPDYQFSIDTALEATASHVDTSMTLTFNKDKITMAHKTVKQGTLEGPLKISSESSFKYPAKSIDMSSAISHEHNADLIKCGLSGTYAGKTISANLNLDKSQTDKYVAEAGLAYPGREMTFKTDVVKMMDGEHKIATTAQWDEGSDSKLAITGSYKAGDVHALTTDIKFPGYPVSITATVKPDIMDMMVRTDVTYKRDTYSLQSQYKLESTSLTSSGSWVCPHRTMAYEVSASNAGGKMTASTDFKWDAARDTNKKVALSVEYDNRDNTNTMSRAATATLTTPYGTEQLSSTFEKTGTTFGRFEISQVHNGVRSEITTRYTTGNGEFTIESPLIQWGPVKVISGRFNHASGHVDGSLSWAPTKTLTADVKWQQDKYSLDVTTPFLYERLGASIEIPTNARQVAKAYWNNQEASFSMSYPSLSAGDFTATYPGHTVTGRFSQTGDLSKFTAETEISYDSDKYSSSVEFNQQAGDFNIEVNTPFAVKKVSLDVSHKGSMIDFTNRATLTWDKQRVRSTVIISPMSSKINVKTPWRDVLASYQITGTTQDFTATTQLKWATDKTINADMKFSNKNGLDMEVSAETPFYSKVTAKLVHNGSMVNFNNRVELSWTPTKDFTATSTFSLTNGVSFDASFVAPAGITGTMKVAHTGNMQKWTNSAEMTYGTWAPMSLYSEFDQSQTKAKVGAKGMPFKSYQSGEAVFDLTTATSKYSTVATLSWNDSQKIAARVTLDHSNGYSATATLATPFTENYSAAMSLTGTMTNFKHTTNLQWAPTKKIAVTAELSDRSGYVAEMTVDSPWRKMSWTANQRGTTQEFNAATVFSWEAGKQISSSLEFSQTGDIKATWTVKTPYDIAKDMSVTLTHRGTTAQYLYTQIEGKYNDQAAQVATTIDMRDGAEFKFITVNPWKNFNSNVKYTGQPMDFTTSADFTMDRETYSTGLIFSFNKALTLDFNLKPVVIKPVMFTINADGLTNTASFTWGDNKTISARANYNLNKAAKSLTGEASFTTPFLGYESGQAEFRHTGSLTSFRNSVEVTFKRDTAKVEAEFSTQGEIKGAMTIASPWYNGNAKFQHQGDLENFTNGVEVTYTTGKTVRANSKWDMRTGVTAEFELTAPFKTIDAKYRHQMSKTGASASSSLTMDNKTIYTTTMNLVNIPSNIEMVFSFECPLKSFSGKYTHRGTMQTRCDASTEFTWDRTNKMSAEWNVSLLNGFATEFTVKSPWKSFSGEVKHEGTLTHFENTLSATCDETRQTVKLVTEFTMSPDFMVKTTLSSPWKNANIMYRHSGTVENFQCNLNGAWGTTPITAVLRWNMLSGYETSIDVSSPWKKFDGSLKTNTDLTNLSSEAKFNWGSQRFQSSLTFGTRSGYTGEVTVDTPWRKMSSNFDVKGMLTNFETNAAVSWETGKSITAEATYKNRVATAKIMSPWRNLSANYQSTGPIENFDSTVDFSWETGKTITIETRADTRTGLDSEVKLTTPWRTMFVSAMYDMSYKMATEVSWETGKSVKVDASYMNRVGSVTVTSPWRNMSANYRCSGSMENSQATMNVSWETGKSITLEARADTRTGLDSELKLTTPWRTMCVSAMYDMSYKMATEVSWEAGKSVKVNASYANRVGSVTVASPWRNLSANYQSTGPIENFEATTDFSWETGKTITLETRADTRTGLNSEVKLTTPWRTMCVSAMYDMSYKMATEVSWETGKSVKVNASYADRVGSITVASPWRNLSANYQSTGPIENFDSTVDFSWETGKTISLETRADTRAGLDSEVKLTTPWRTMSANAKSTGTIDNFDSTMSISWESGKMITSTVAVNRQNGWTHKVTLDSPWRQMETNGKFTGEMTSFESELDITLEAGQTMTTKATFDLTPLKATWSYKCPHNDLSAELSHTGTMTDFTNFAFFKWAADKKVEVVSTFKMADNISGQATIKSPFYSNFEASFEHTPTSGEVSLTTPFTDRMDAEYTYTDMYNVNGKITHGSNVYTGETVTSWNNGVQTLIKATCPHHTYSMEVDHQGTDYTFTNTMEAKYDSATYKVTTSCDVNTKTYSQVIETPIAGYEKMEWSANWNVTNKSATTKLMIAKNNQKIEVDATGDVEWKKYKTIITSTVKVATPFADWEDNQMTGSFEYSQRLINYKLTGYKGTAANTKNFQFYAMSTVSGLESYVKTNFYGEEESSIEVNYNINGDRLTAEYKADVKFATDMNVDMSIDITHSRSSSGLNHTGLWKVTCGKGLKTIEWNAGSNHYMCETGFKYTNVGEEIVSYTHKTTWTSAYDKLSHDMTVKSVYEPLKDCAFNLTYDFTQAKKTMTVTAFNNPMKPIDFKSEFQTGDSMTAMVELTTPWECCKMVKTTVALNKASQPWTVKVDATYNDQTMSGEGRVSYTSAGQFDTSMSFTSEIPSMESLQFTASNNQLNGQWKPHMTASWAANKKIEMSGTFSWTNQYKASMDISTPFDSLRSLVTDITVNNQMPTKLTTSFDFKTNKMSEKLASTMTLDMPNKSFALTMSSPFETVRSFEVTGTVTPRITAAVKLNGTTYFSVNGNGHFESWAKHDLDVTLTYPFFNRFMRVKVINQFSTSAVSSQIDLEYMRGKEITSKLTFTPGSTTTISVAVTTPFEKFENMKYSLSYSGTPTNWTETTQVEFHYGKVTTQTSFSLNNGATYHQTMTGEMKNGWQNFNMQKDFVLTGTSLSSFDLTYGLSGSMLPTVSLETKWDQSRMTGSVKATVNQSYMEYVHTGEMSDFTCNWKLRQDSDEWVGTWSVKTVAGLTASVDITCPHDSRVKFSLNADELKGSMDGMWKMGTQTLNSRSSYSRSASPFSYTAATTYWTEENGRRVDDKSLDTSFSLTKESLNYSWKYDGKQIFALRAANRQNTDDEYVPTITMDLWEEKYEFDGLFKNEGEGLVRDFKLHMKGPKSMPNNINFQFEFRTQSSQLVPGDMRFYLSHTGTNGQEEKITDMNASWGNDHALVTFVAPQPMRYAMDFSVSTSGQSGTIEANWDTSKANKQWKLTFNNKFTGSSRRMRSELDMDVIYMGVSRGFTSNMDWQTASFAHKLTVDYNGKQMGYDVVLSETAGKSLEIITQWRNVKLTWKNDTLSNGNEMSYGLYWDSARDMTKKFTGVSRWEQTAANTYKWTSTFSHPAFAKDIVITDTMSYDTSRVYAAFNKVVSFSTDSSKDITFDLVLEKNGKWGVELKQAFNKIDMRFGTEFTATGTATSVMYKAANGRMKTFAFNTNYNADNKAVTVELTTPIKTIKIETLATLTTYTISATVDGKTYTSAFTVRPTEYYMLVKLTGDAQSIEFEAKRLTGGYQIQLAKVEGPKTTVEARAALSMDENRTISGDLRWNPAMYSEIKSKLASLRAELKDTVKTMSAATTGEATKKMNRMQLGSDFDQIMPTHQTELALFKQDVNAAKITLQRAYSGDVMMMKTIDEATRFAYSQIMDEFEVLSDRIVEYYGQVIEPRLGMIGEKTEQVLLDLTNQLAVVEEKLMSLRTTAATKWNAQLTAVSEDLDMVAQWLQAYVDKISNYMAKLPSMATLRSIHSTTMDKFNTYSSVVMDKTSAITNAQMYTDAIYGAHTYVNGAINKFSDASSFDMDYVTGLSDSLMYKIKFYFDYYDVTDHIKNFMTHSKNVAAEYLNDYLTHYVDQTLNDFKWVAYDVDAGHIQVELTIPTTMNTMDLAELKTDLKQRLDTYIAYMSKYRWNLKEMFYMYKPRAIGQILPPFDAQAIIAGQHIRTFDRRHYDFSSSTCSYLLARDFHDGNFTVFVNYNGAEQSLTVHSNGKTIDIDQDNSVKMDGSKIELPVEFFNTTISRMGAKIVMSSRLGVEVVCDNLHGLCTVEMSGHYFAKTGGMFGTYNYESSDDWTTSQNTNSSSVTAFANSWASRCTGTNNAKSYAPVEGTKEFTACSALFTDSSSSLAPCFKVVDAKNAFHKCINDMSIDVSLTSKNGPCKAAKFYENECRFAGIDVLEPAQCVSCEVGSSTITAEDSPVQINTPVMAADVVFIVEEKMCNYDIDNKLPTLAKLMEGALGKNSYTDIRFGLVGFGGEGVHKPSHTHTMASKMFATRAELSLGTSALKFATDDSNKDVFAAIDFAAQYPFRAGASKVLIVLPCSDCSESKLSYRSIAARLNTENINVHVMNNFDYEVTVDGKNPPTNYLFGIDDNAIYTLRDLKAMRGNTNLYSIISKPTDACSTLALSTGGTIFNKKMMTEMRSSTVKSFQTVFANRLAMTTYPNRCTSCSCEYNPMFGMSRTVCNKC